MKKTMLFLFIVLFLDCIALGYIQDEISLYGDFFQDLRYFPLAVPKETSAVKEFSFEDTWMAKHHREGTRKHEGCDIFGKNSVSGYYPVVSMTDGTVENVGWLPLGGWRIGIRSRHGGYFYYAHLHSYGRAFSLGDKVKAGEMLGLWAIPDMEKKER